MSPSVIALPPVPAGVRPPVPRAPVEQPHSRKAGARAVAIPVGDATLEGTLIWPCHPSGFVLVTRARRGRQAGLEDVHLAARLRTEGLGTLLIERITGSRGSDSEFQPGQFQAAAEWLGQQPEAAGLPMGYLSIGVGTSGTLAAAGSSARLAAVVSYGGDPGVLGDRLYVLRPPTLLIVGDSDYERLRILHPALVRFGGPTWLTTIPGAASLHQARALEEAGHRAAQWFVRHLTLEPAWRALHMHA